MLTSRGAVEDRVFGFDVESSSRCVLCDSLEETSSHLFLHCEVAFKVFCDHYSPKFVCVMGEVRNKKTRKVFLTHLAYGNLVPSKAGND